MAERARRPPPGRPGAGLATALLPVGVAGLGVLATAAAGVTERSFIGTPVEDRFYGFFLRSYPLFAFCLLYGAARIAMAALTAPGRRRGLRLLTAPVGLALFLAAGLYPTFGGLVLRAGYGLGAGSFLNGVPGVAATALGAVGAALAYGAALGLGAVLASLRLAAGRAPAAWGLLRLGALCLGATLLAFAAPASPGPAAGFPVVPLGAPGGLAAAALVCLALLPHALATAAADHARPAAACRAASNSAHA
jgi:hypothetical protein